uniref:Ataxin-7-like protein 1 n=1 Tax=Xiphophorus couchianus TaxID=32473 RepID=A0A3B5M6L1_9TELE
MATLDRQIPSPDTFLCEPWSSFVSATKLRFVDKMLVCTHFPALEDFCLVVCHVCSKVVTPQGILTHYGKFYMGIPYGVFETGLLVGPDPHQR